MKSIGKTGAFIRKIFSILWVFSAILIIIQSEHSPAATASQPICELAANSCVRFDTGPTYLYAGDKLWCIKDPETYALLGFNTGDCLTPDWSLTTVLPGQVPRDLIGGGGNALPYKGMAVVIKRSVGPNSCDSGENGIDDSRAYYFDGAKFRWIPDPDIYFEMGYKRDWSDLIPITRLLFDKYGEEIAISSAFEVLHHDLPDNICVQFDTGPTFLYANNQLWPVKDPETYALLGFNTGDCMTPDWSLTEKFHGEAPDAMVVKRDNALSYQGIPFQGMVADINKTVGPNSCGSQGDWQDDGRAYYFDGEKFQWVRDPDVYFEMGYKWDWSDLVPMTQDLFDRYGEGENITQAQDMAQWEWMTLETETCFYGFWENETVAIAVGDHGRVFMDRKAENGARYKNWTLMETPTTADLRSVWGVSENDVYAVGEYGAIHFDGTRWTETIIENTPYLTRLTRIWGTGPDNVFANANNPQELFHFDGVAWSVVSEPDPENHDIYFRWATSTDDLYVMERKYTPDSCTTIYHYNNIGQKSIVFDGLKHYQKTGGKCVYFEDLWKAPSGVIFAVGQTVDTRDNSRFITASIFDGARQEHTDFTPEKTYSSFYMVTGESATNVVATSISGRVVHFNGTNWETIRMPTVNDLTTDTLGHHFSGLWMNAESHVFLANENGGIWRYDGDKWEEIFVQTFFENKTPTIQSVSGRHYNRYDHTSNFHYTKHIAYAVGQSAMSTDQGAILYKNPTANYQWFFIEAPFGASYPILKDVWINSELDAVAVGEGGRIFHVKEIGILYLAFGINEMETPTSACLNAICGLEGHKQPIYAVGNNGTVLRYEPDEDGFGNNQWEQLIFPSQTNLLGIWGDAEDNLFVVGAVDSANRFPIFQFDGSAWNAVSWPDETGFPVTLHAITGTPRGKVWAVGEGGAIVGYDGIQWRVYVKPFQVPNYTSYDSYDIWCGSESDIFIVGESETPLFGTDIHEPIWHFNGQHLTEYVSGFDVNDLLGIWGTTEGHVYAVGTDGAVLYLQRRGSRRQQSASLAEKN